MRDGLTVFVTTAYLDEAERCNRVGLMNHGKMIRCESPQALKHTLKETCYEVETADQRAARELLQSQPGVLAVEPYGSKLHLFLTRGSAARRIASQSRLSSVAFASPFSARSCLRSKTSSSAWSGSRAHA